MEDRDKVITFLAKLLHEVITCGLDHVSEDDFLALDQIVGQLPEVTSSDFICDRNTEE